MQDTFARATLPVGQARRATIGYLVYECRQDQLKPTSTKTHEPPLSDAFPKSFGSVYETTIFQRSHWPTMRLIIIIFNYENNDCRASRDANNLISFAFKMLH